MNYQGSNSTRSPPEAGGVSVTRVALLTGDVSLKVSRPKIRMSHH